jgi:hypothetical protein
MEKEKIYAILNSSEENSRFRIVWDRGNGLVDRIVSFERFNLKEEPLLRLEDSKDYLDINRIGGYDSIKDFISIISDNPHAEYSSSEIDGMC